MKRKPLFHITLSAIFAALTTALILLHVPYGLGILHAGDAVILLAACLLPKPYAMATAGIGGGLANLIAAPMWTPATVIIKPAVAALFSAKHEKLLARRNMLMCFPYALITMGGYFLAHWVILGWEAATLQVLAGDLVQSAVSSGLFFALAAAMDRVKMKQRLHLR